MLSVAVCVITYRRPFGLRRLLDSLALLQFPRNPGVRPVIAVVDNDPSGSGKEVVDSICPGFPWELRYEVEAGRGIPMARNRSVRLASGCDFLAFVDDDEVVDRNWLDYLLETASTWNASIVSGRVDPIFEGAVPKWIADGGYYDRPSAAPGMRLKFAATNNVLVRADILRDIPGPFDERFSITGGSDTCLFTQLQARGHRIIADNRAMAWEWIPESRQSVRWILMRSYRSGNVYARADMAAHGTWRAFSRQLVRSVALIGLGLAATVIGVTRGRTGIVGGLRRVTRGAGGITGLLGRHYNEYVVVHGR